MSFSLGSNCKFWTLAICPVWVLISFSRQTDPQRHYVRSCIPIVVIGKKNARRILCLHCHCYMIPGGLLFPLSEDSELPPPNKRTNIQTSESFNKTHKGFSAMCQELAYEKNLSALTDRIPRKLRMSCDFSSHEFQIFSVGTTPPPNWHHSYVRNCMRMARNPLLAKK
jgi:hypothetical protein